MILISVKCIPNAARYLWKIDGEMIKCYIPAPAVDGKANDFLIKRLSKALKVPKSDITIYSGILSRTKKIAIATELTYEEVLDLIFS